MPNTDTIALEQLDNLERHYDALRRRSAHSDLSDLDRGEYMGFIAAARAAVERVAGRDSAYVRQAEAMMDKYGAAHPVNAANLQGIAKALRSDVANGYLQNLKELLHSDLFSDFLEMADHLLETGYKDAAAVISGTALEVHLKQLAAKHAISLTTTIKGEDVPKKADRLNADLVAAEVYGKLEQKSVTAWLDLRNKAAHGDYAAYSADQVRMHVDAIRYFISRYPA